MANRRLINKRQKAFVVSKQGTEYKSAPTGAAHADKSEEAQPVNVDRLDSVDGSNTKLNYSLEPIAGADL
ncbi:hypothetical protein SAMN05444274_102138 [Mariniphaga anaerophila]|uniref:Uncharacterized protein n=1 Tax=Mariniphaga anaerophila TaxID=1484053 RepID=A0A1M4VM49_9BACT|nr:hypothetical protein [Mariniphaga anaerophila]SHE69907.1 hypothetical protein SAMN05444274_102138 [Mariniphaga anaerophila]